MDTPINRRVTVSSEQLEHIGKCLAFLHLMNMSETLKWISLNEERSNALMRAIPILQAHYIEITKVKDLDDNRKLNEAFTETIKSYNDDNLEGAVSALNPIYASIFSFVDKAFENHVEITISYLNQLTERLNSTINVYETIKDQLRTASISH